MSINSDAADLLESAAFVIGAGHHAKGYYAKNLRGDETSRASPEACSWCAIGAILAAEDEFHFGLDAYELAMDALDEDVGFIPAWNDARERTPEEVEAAMLKAAAKLRGEA